MCHREGRLPRVKHIAQLLDEAMTDAVTDASQRGGPA